MKRNVLLALLLAAALVAAGCGSSGTAGLTHVVTTETAYYETSPAQKRAADGTLPVGTEVRIVREAGSYVKVATEEGLTAFIAADAIEAKD